MGRKPTSGGVRPKGGRIEVRFKWQGKQIAPTLPLKPTAANLKHAARVRIEVMALIARGAFRIQDHFPDYRYAQEMQPAEEDAGQTLGDWALTWQQISSRSLEHSTLAIYVRHLRAYWLPSFGHLLPEQVTHLAILKHLAKLSTDRFDENTGKTIKGLSRKTQNNIMIPLRAVFGLICRHMRNLRDPTEGIENQKTQKGRPDPFAPAEVEAILKALRAMAPHGDAMADYFEFSFFAGMRPSEQIALRWEDVNLKAGTMRVHRARVLTEDKARTKTHVERHVELNHRALGVLLRQHARTSAHAAEVFFNPRTEAAYADEQSQRRAWVQAVSDAGVRYRPPKECRDTSVTIALMAGANPVWVAMQHGHSVQVMMRDYAKWIPSADRGANLAALNATLARSTEGAEPPD